MLRIITMDWRKFLMLLGQLLMLGFLSLANARSADQFEVLHAFPSSSARLVGRLVQDNKGNSYGLTGFDNAGLIYKIDAAGRYSVVHYFEDDTGSKPSTGLVEGHDRKFYGVTEYGGKTGQGTVFQLDISGTTAIYSVIHSFDGSNGFRPNSLISGNEGKLLGTTYQGGQGFGTIFQIDISGASPVYTVLHVFDDYAFGGFPDGLIQGSDSKFYGTAGGGSILSGLFGVVFQLDNSEGFPVYKVLHEFDGSRGSNGGNLIQGNNGTLYGIAQIDYSEGGILFQIDPSGPLPSYSILYDFQTMPSGLMRSLDGNFYGTTCFGGSASSGTFFRLDLSGMTPVYSSLYEFEQSTTGVCPKDGVIQGVDGKFYGSISNVYGGPKQGKVFQLDISKSMPFYKVLYSYDDSTITNNPSALVQGSDGKLYGGTKGDTNGVESSVFRLDISGLSPVYSDLFYSKDSIRYLTKTGNNNIYGFSLALNVESDELFQLDIAGVEPVYKNLIRIPGFRADSAWPRGLIQGSDGKLYGSTTYGGNALSTNNSAGTIFQIDFSGTAPVYNLMHKFDFTNGANPIAGVIQANNGKLYGTTSAGGSADKGTLFQLDVSGKTPAYSVLHSFDSIHGASGVGLIQGRDSNLYGTTELGGIAGKGTIFRLDLSGRTPKYTVIHEFDGANGAYPGINFIQAIDGKLYGTTHLGGRTNNGTLFQLDISQTPPVYRLAHEFDASKTGAFPSVVLQGNDGNFYGIANGGELGGGVVYRLTLKQAFINTSPVAKNDSYVLDIRYKNKSVTIPAPGVMRNDKDADNDKMTIVINAKNGMPKIIPFPHDGGKLALYLDGHFEYTPPKNCNTRTHNFPYQVTDGKATSEPASVTLTIRCELTRVKSMMISHLNINKK